MSVATTEEVSRRQRELISCRREHRASSTKGFRKECDDTKLGRTRVWPRASEREWMVARGVHSPHMRRSRQATTTRSRVQAGFKFDQIDADDLHFTLPIAISKLIRIPGRGFEVWALSEGLLRSCLFGSGRLSCQEALTFLQRRQPCRTRLPSLYHFKIHRII